MTNDANHQPEFVWDVHPARERLDRTLLAILVIVVFGVVATRVGEASWYGVVSAFVFIGLLNRFFFPSRFTVDEEGITASYPLRRKRVRWSELRRFDVGREGGCLSRRIRQSAFAGGDVQVLFGAHRDRALAAIRAHLPEGVRA